MCYPQQFLKIDNKKPLRNMKMLSSKIFPDNNIVSDYFFFFLCLLFDKTSKKIALVFIINENTENFDYYC